MSWLAIGLVLLGISACAGTGPASAPPSVDVTGNWAGQWVFEDPSAGSGQVSMSLKQTGANVSGDVRVTGPSRARPVTFTGLVSGNEVRIVSGNLSGSLMVKGDDMTGTVFGILPANVTLKRQR